MDDALAFRCILLVQIAIAMPIEAYFRWKARVPGERLDRTQEGVLALVVLRAALAARIAAIVVYIVAPSQLAWCALPLPAGWRWLGAACAVGATLANVWTFRHLGRNLTDTVVARRSAQLVTSGPYRFVRHPLYGASVLYAVADTLLTTTWLLLAIDAVMGYLLWLRTPLEEARLLEQFGEQYERYRSRTPRYFPTVFQRNASPRES